MANYTYELATDIVFPFIDVYRRYRDGVLTGYKVCTQEGYVMYDTTATDTEIAIDPETGLEMQDPETGEYIEVPTTYYYTLMYCPLNTDFNNFTWVAVPRDSVDAVKGQIV